jgi:hypothetical protein
VHLEGLDQLKKIHLIGPRTCDFLACSIVPQPVMLLRAPDTVIICALNISIHFSFRVHVYALILHIYIHQCLYSPLLGLGLFSSFIIFFTQMVGLLGRVISPSQGHNLCTGQHKHRINADTDIHALSGIRTHIPSIQAADISCLRPRGHCDWLALILAYLILSA